MNNKMNIPPTIKVGYQNRNDTFTKKLAYVVYVDQKGVLRKEASWEKWRDKKIDPQEFPNSPTSGFVLNKKVGDYKSDWNHRRAAIRIYDPRDFEFEISVENLLYILEECSSIKGKGLEGEFVYAWHGSDLVLLPTTSQEYKISSEFTQMKTMKVPKSDIKEGCIYVNKDMEKVMYLGKHELYRYDSQNENGKRIFSHKSEGKKHVFRYMDIKKPSYGEPIEYWEQNGFTNLASKISDEVDQNFPTYYDKFTKTKRANKCNQVVFTLLTPSKENLIGKCHYSNHKLAMKKDDKYYVVYIEEDKKYDTITKEYIVKGYIIKYAYGLIIENDSIVLIGDGWRNLHYSSCLTLEELYKNEFYQVSLVNKYGDKFEFHVY